jgi:hypothetical protein
MSAKVNRTLDSYSNSKEYPKNVDNVIDDNVSLLQWSELIANDGGNLKDNMPTHEAIAKDDGNLKGDMDLVEAPTNDVNYGIDGSCQNVEQLLDLLTSIGNNPKHESYGVKQKVLHKAPHKNGQCA